LITRISVIGISVTTAALIILISAFNGIEKMVDKLYSEFDANIIIQSKKGKTFNENDINFNLFKDIPEIKAVSKAVEEIVIIKHEKKWVNANLIGVEEEFLKMADLSNHIVDGNAFIAKNNENFALVGAVLLDRLNGYIHDDGDFELVTVYFPKRNAKISQLKNPFKIENIKIAGRINYNKEVNEEAIIVPINFAKEMLNYSSDITSIYINIYNKSKLENVKNQLQKILGANFEVKTYLEKNKLIYQTSKSEKIIVIFILIFVFILAIFNLVSSLTMMYIEKIPHLKTLSSFGFEESMVFKTFFYHGCFISLKGISFGFILGVFIFSIQYFGNIIILPNSNNEAFPVVLTFSDVILVLFIVLFISILASYLTVLFLVKNLKNQTL
jgi:lipoprotein-releasing system permease protein